MSTPAIPLRLGEGFTVEDWLALPDDGLRYELIDGSYRVTPAPTASHQRLLNSLLWLIREVCPAGMSAVYSGAGVAPPDRSAANALIPDILVIRDRQSADAGGDVIRPDEVVLAVEVVSPSSRRTDHNDKPDVYADWGVPFYWLVDQTPTPKITCLRLDGERYVEYASGAPDDVLDVTEPFAVRLPVAELFAR